MAKKMYEIDPDTGYGKVKETKDVEIFEAQSIQHIDGLIMQYNQSIANLQAEIAKLEGYKTEFKTKGLKEKP